MRSAGIDFRVAGWLFRNKRDDVSLGTLAATISSRHASPASHRANPRACAPLPQHACWHHSDAVQTARPRIKRDFVVRTFYCGCAVRTVPEPHVQLAAQLLQFSLVPGAHGVGIAQERATADELRLNCRDALDQREKAIVACHVYTPELATL